MIFNTFIKKMNMLILCVVCFVVQSIEASYDPDYVDFEMEILPSEPNRVLVCLNTDNQLTALTKLPEYTDIRFKLIDSFPDLNIEFPKHDSCQYEIEAQDKTIAAAIAPKPINLSAESSDIPIYFFDTPYLDEEDAGFDAFPNGVFPLRGHWQSLKYALSHYVTTHGWKRIGIISDDSYYSQAFEIMFVEHLKEKEIVYNAQGCVITRFGCNFERAMRFFKRQKTFIIIVNVQAENAKKLVAAARSFQMVSSRYVWLVRDWPFENVYTEMFKHMVSLTLSPLPAPGYKFDHDGPRLNSVWRGLALISLAIKNEATTQRGNEANEESEKRIDYYYKSIYSIMNSTNKCDRSKLFIRKFTSGVLVDVHSTVVHNSGHVGPYSKDPVFEKVPDLAEFCLHRSRSFEDPCYDTWIVIICVVWLMFIIMVVLLIYFFNRCLVWT